jgi:DNA invertase Pin-like site-specific DNA recombinase
MSKSKKIPLPREGKIAAVYCRKSDLTSGEAKGRSTSQQLQQSTIATQSLGFEVPERLIFLDEDGNKGHWYWKDPEGRNPGPFRPELTRLMEEVNAGNVDAVFCYRSDRCYRDEVVASFFLDALRAKGVKFFCRSQDMAIHTAGGRESCMTQACSNASMRAKVSEDVIRDHAMLASVGELPRDVSCLGFKSAGRGSKRVVANDQQIAIIRKTFDMYVFGEDGEAPLSASEIAYRFMQYGYRTSVGARGHKCADPDRVLPGAITRILRNPAYMGKINHDGKLFDTHHFDVAAPDGSGRTEPVVSEAVFQAAQERLSHGNRYERSTGWPSQFARSLPLLRENLSFT